MQQTGRNNIDRDINPQETGGAVWSDGVSPLFLEVHQTNLSTPTQISYLPDGTESIVRE